MLITTQHCPFIAVVFIVVFFVGIFALISIHASGDEILKPFRRYSVRFFGKVYDSLNREMFKTRVEVHWISIREEKSVGFAYVQTSPLNLQVWSLAIDFDDALTLSAMLRAAADPESGESSASDGGLFTNLFAEVAPFGRKENHFGAIAARNYIYPGMARIQIHVYRVSGKPGRDVLLTILSKQFLRYKKLWIILSREKATTLAGLLERAGNPERTDFAEIDIDAAGYQRQRAENNPDEGTEESV